MGDHHDSDGDGLADHGDHLVAQTAGEQDHSDPWWWAGEDADPPASTDEDAAAGGDR